MPPSQPPAAGTIPTARLVDRIPDVALDNHRGERVRLVSDLLADRAVIVNTMFTVCRGSCPGTSQALHDLRPALWPIFGPRLVIVSFTLEPEVDTPEVLRDYAAAYGADTRAAHLPDWQFLTGSTAAIERMRRALGLYDLDPAVDRDPTRHAAVLLCGNPLHDRWAILPSALRRGLLVEGVRRVAGFTFEQRYGIRA